MDKDLLSENELNDRLRKDNPVSRAALDDESVRVALAAVRSTIQQGTYAEGPSRSTSRPVYRRRLVMAGTAAAAVFAASLVGVETLTGGAGGANLPLAVSPAAAAQLNRVAHAAAGQAALGAGQWLYVNSVMHSTGMQQAFSHGKFAPNTGVGFSYTQDDQLWIDADGDQRVRTTDSNFAFATPQDRATYEANKADFPNLHYFMGSVSDDAGPNRAEQGIQQGFSRLSTDDPKTLLAEIPSLQASFQAAADTSTVQSAASGADETTTAAPDTPQLEPYQVWQWLTVILTTSASSQLRSTAYAALAYVPGTKVLGNQTDSLGRTGVAISFTDPDWASENNSISARAPIQTLIADPSTGDLLEWESPGGSVQTAGGKIEAGNDTTYAAPAIVNSDTSLPDGSTVPLDTNAASK